MHSYHHGDLRQALIDATEMLLAEKGPEAFSLREVARRAGVSAAAPAHHFGDSRGLLTTVAILGFDGLAASLREGEARGGKDARLRLREQGVAYVEFAMTHPGRFRLMFREGMLHDDPELKRSGNAAFMVLENGIREAFAIPAHAKLGAPAWTALLALWSVVHGFSHLTIAGRFDALAAKGGRSRFVTSALRPVLQGVIEGSVPAKRRKGAGAR